MNENEPLTEQQIRAIIQDELKQFSLNTRTQADKTIFQRNIQLLDGRSIQVGRTNGTMIGTASDQKISLFGATPVVQKPTITPPSGGSTIDTQARTAITLLITAAKDIGITN